MNQIPLFNPLKEDFTITYDINGDSQPVSYTLHGKEIEYFDPTVAEHIAKHLADKVLWEEGIKTNYEDDIKTVLERIKVKL